MTPLDFIVSMQPSIHYCVDCAHESNLAGPDLQKNAFDNLSESLLRSEDQTIIGAISLPRQ